MFIGIERSTDQRCPNTKIKKFSTEKALRAWMSKGGGYTHENPKEARNYHHDIRYGYEHVGRIPRIKRDPGSRDYPRTEKDDLCLYLWETARNNKARCREIE